MAPGPYQPKLTCTRRPVRAYSTRLEPLHIGVGLRLQHPAADFFIELTKAELLFDCILTFPDPPEFGLDPVLQGSVSLLVLSFSNLAEDADQGIDRTIDGLGPTLCGVDLDHGAADQVHCDDGTDGQNRDGIELHDSLRV